MLSQAALHENGALGVFERGSPGEAIQKSSDRSYWRVKCKEAVKEWGKRKMETKGLDGASNQLSEHKQRAE